MRRVSVALALVTAGCALSGAPAWVREQSFVCESASCPQTLSGVGEAEAGANPSLRRAKAEATARNALAQLVLRRIRGDVPDAFRTLVNGSLVGSEIADHWVSRDETEYALAVLTRASMKQALTARTDLSAEQRGAFVAQIDALFGR